MGYLIAGIAVFAGVHLFSMLLPGQRDALKARMGEGPYKGIYALVSLAGLALMIWGFWLSIRIRQQAALSMSLPHGRAM